MLYVFQVDTGTMLTFDMNLALESVSTLKESIWSQYRIPIDRQVLLVSGGECLEPSSRVHSYAAGTDTNPIYLFNKLHIESSPTSSGQQSGTLINPSNPHGGSLENLTTGTDYEAIKDQIESTLPPTYLTVVTRSQLAQQLHDMAKDLTRQCESIIRDQHLQHQGWAAVVANLEDIIGSFKGRIENFEQIFVNHMAKKDERMEIINGFDSDLSLLSQINLIPCLVPTELTNHTTNPATLLAWIESQDPSTNLTNFISNVKQCLQENLDPQTIETLQREARVVIEKAGQSRMIEIKGLEERLIGLDQLLAQAKKKVQEQYELAQGFLQNQNRASELKDSSILQDLCESHKHQLSVMHGNHQVLEDIFRRCSKAKEELSANLNQRLKWVMMVQKSMVDTSNKLTMYQERFKRVRCQVEVVEQIHTAVETYCQAVVEVVRRRRFSEEYLKWSTNLSSHISQIYHDELNHRRNFSAKFDSHFLSGLFPGMNDMPPEFATQCPNPFDNHLPKIQVDDIEYLQSLFPSSVSYEDSAPDFTRIGTTLDQSHPISDSKISIDDNTVDEEANKIAALELENANLKLTLESLQCELQSQDQIHQLQLQDKEVEMFNIQAKLATIESLFKTMESEIELLKKTSSEWDKEKENMIHTHEEAIKKLIQEKEDEINSIKENGKADMEALRSRYRLMTSFDQQQNISKNSPSDSSNVDKSFDSIPKSGTSSDLTSELTRIIDSIQKNPNETMSPQLIRKILMKLDSQTARTRNISETSGLRTSFEGVDEESLGLDTSAIDAAASSMTMESAPDEVSEQLIPPQKVVNVATRLVQLERICVQGVKAGDSVFVFWNANLQTYMIYTNTKNVHFLHTDCLKLIANQQSQASGDTVPPSPQGFTAQVVDKEFCVARRSGNRYRVPQGFHFYRVKVKIIEILDLDSFLSP